MFQIIIEIMYRNGLRGLQRVVCQLKINSRYYAKKDPSTKLKTQIVGGASVSAAKFKRPLVDEVIDSSINASFMEKTIGGAYRKWQAVMEKHPELKSLKRKDIINTALFLKSLGFTADDILMKPMLLFTSSLTLENRYSVLRESGFQNITIAVLFKYITIINKAVSLLKTYNYIPADVNVVENLRKTFTDIELKLPAEYLVLNEQIPLKKLRECLLSYYLMARIGMTDNDVEKLWRVYGRVRHKSFRSVQNMINILHELKFSNERITKNAFLLHGDVENVRRILQEVKTIDEQDIRDIVYRRPKILMSPCDSLLKTLEHVKAFGIGEEAVLRCLEVLTLGPDTVLERLRDLNEIEEFQVLASNPRVLRLVHYQNKARLRLEYLNQLKVRCASLHILSCDSEAFAKFARDGSDRTKGCDVVVYLSHKLLHDDNLIRSILARHPNWCHVPLVHVKKCYEFLLSKKFDNENIFNNIHVLLYPITRIEEKLQQLQSNEFVTQIQPKISNVHELSNDEMLTLVLYLIEYDFHFTGDGIWTEQHAHQMENFNNLLPDFPESLNKIYKYGVKPAINKDSILQPEL